MAGHPNNLLIARRGVTLIMVAATLAILAALATGFYTMMLSQSVSAYHYSDSVRAEMLAKGGVSFAVAKLRALCYLRTEDPYLGSGAAVSDAWYQADYLNGARTTISFPGWDASGNRALPFSASVGSVAGTNSDRITLNVADSASKININAGDNLAVILDNLCRVIGPPLVAANLDAIQPRRWAAEMLAGDPMSGVYDNALNALDTNRDGSGVAMAANPDLYYWLYDSDNTTVLWKNGDWIVGVTDTQKNRARPLQGADGAAVYGDGYAMAGYRARNGRYQNLSDVKKALTWISRADGNRTLEEFEREVKYAAIREYITTDSWVDTSTVCTGKLEWVTSFNAAGAPKSPPPAGVPGYSVAIDRDKSWIPSGSGDTAAFRADPNGFKNERGSLIGSTIVIVNGHGSGQRRTIVDNGVDWVRVEPNFTVDPGPVSSYMIVARDPAPYAPFVDGSGSPTTTIPTPIAKQTLLLPLMDNLGNLAPNPNIDYSLRPLCIHRAPVNINTASDKVLEALFLGINVQHGHPMSIGTDADLAVIKPLWRVPDPHGQETSFGILTAKGLKRTPASPGKPALNRPVPWNSPLDDGKFEYLTNKGGLGAPNFAPDTAGVYKACTEAHELAYRVIMARTRTQPYGTLDPDPTTADAGDGPRPYNAVFAGYERGPFRSWDDLYFRAIKPWDDIRSGYFINGKPSIPNSGMPPVTVGLGQASVARMLMANFNPNTDILKFNPNVEWIDRWGRNFTQLEPVMAFTNDAPDDPAPSWYGDPAVAAAITAGSKPIFSAQQIQARAGGNLTMGPSWEPTFLNPAGTIPNPNAGAYLIRSFRYMSDEMIDKTDLNRSTTEFSFDSKGIFEIKSVGQVVLRSNVLAERKVEALVKVYDVWRETTQRQFVQGTISKAAPVLPPTSQTVTAPYPNAYNTTFASYQHSGQVARDSVNVNDKLALNTLPEPLVPLGYKLGATPIPSQEVVDPGGVIRDQYGNPKRNPLNGSVDPSVPDVTANRILPAGYDGQIVLATNTSKFDPTGPDQDTFLASFNGDLDTDTCNGNGREQAKVPYHPNPPGAPDGYKYRVVNTCSLIGILNDDMIDIDTDLPAGKSVYRWKLSALKGLNPLNYWENVSLRLGDLRSDGVWLSGPAVSGNEATLKYVFGDGSKVNDSATPGNAKANFNPGSPSGNLVTMWLKPAWHHDDHHTHDLFDATNPGWRGQGFEARAFYLKKFGGSIWASQYSDDKRNRVSFNRARSDDLNFTMEGNVGLNQNDGERDMDCLTYLHGGFNIDPAQFKFREPQAPRNGRWIESPCYRVQPFRWCMAGARWVFNQKNEYTANTFGGMCEGHWISGGDGQIVSNGWRPSLGVNPRIIGQWVRPFISTQLFPETPPFNPNFYTSYWSGFGCYGTAPHYFKMPPDIGDTGAVGAWFGSYGQPAKWSWADPPTTAATEDTTHKVFGINNINEGDAHDVPPYIYEQQTWIYHQVPADGTYGVIDELKISSSQRLLKAPLPQADPNIATFPAPGDFTGGPVQADYDADRGYIEQTLSRYYLPDNPGDPAQCPTFTSQTMLSSLKGFGAGTPAQKDFVDLARVTWTVFTPRFMSEYKKPTFNRVEHITRDLNNQNAETDAFRGPFDYDKYNEKFTANPPPGLPLPQIFPYGVDRPTPRDYGGQAQATRGVEIEMLNGGVKIPGSVESIFGSGVFNSCNGTFANPDLLNRFLDSAGLPVPAAHVSTDALQYRVRFRYPVDTLADPNGGPWTDALDPANPQKMQFLLDTPVFDDISVTYMIAPQILSYKEVSE